MIGRDALAIEPWTVRETRLHLDVLAQTESIFALSTATWGCAATSRRARASAVPGTYLDGFYELRPSRNRRSA